MKRYLHILIAFLSLFSASQLYAQCPVASDFSVTSTKDVTCFGGADGEMVVTASGTVNTALYNFILRDILEPGTPIVTFPLGSVTVTVSGQTITFQGLTASSYIMQVTRKSPNCNINVFSGVNINQPDELLLSVTAQTNITGCFGDKTGSFTVSATGGNTGYEYSIDGTTYQTSPTFSGLAAGSYTVSVRDGKGCINTTTVTLTQPTLLQLTLSSKTDPLCNGNSNGTISVSASGGTGPYTYSTDGVNFSNTTGNFSGLASGNYTITVKDSKGCTAQVSNISLVDPAVLTVDLGSKTDILGCNGDATGQIQVTATGGTSPYTYSINGATFVSNGGLFTGLIAGTYTIVVKDAKGCTVTLAPVTLDQPAKLTLALQAQTNILGCYGDATGDITVTASGGQPAYEYSKDGTTFQASPTFAGLTAGTYTITVRDTKGCTTTVNATLTQPTQLNATVVTSNPLCNGDANGSITVTASGAQPAYEYSINGGTYQTSNVFSSLIAGTYSIKVRDSKGCEITLPDVVLTEPNVLAVTIASQQDVQNCFGDKSGQITVAATGGTTNYQYSIDGGTTYQSSPTFSNLGAGTYTIIVKDAHNCTVTSVGVTIAQPTLLTLSLTSQVDILGCNGDATGQIQVTANGGTAPYTYSKDGTTFVSNGGLFTGLTAASYTIVVKDAKGCTATVPATLTQPTQLASSLVSQTNILCNGDATGDITVTATGGQPAYEYSKDGTTFQASPTFTGLTAGTYTITVRDIKGCTTTVNATLTQPTKVVATVSAQQDISCNGGSNGSITVNVSGGTAPYTYSKDGTTFVSNGGLFTGLTAASYTIVVKDANGCTTTLAPVTLIEPAVLQVSVASTTDVSCNGGNTGSLTVAATGGTPGYQYSKDGITFQASSTFTGLTAGTYTITVRDNKNCTTTTTATIGQPTALVLTTSSTNASCNGVSDGTAGVVVSGGTAAYTYSWNTSPVRTTATVSGLAAGTYTVTVTDANGCIQTASVTITQPAVVTAPVASNPAAICTGGTIPTLTATGSNIQWYSDASLVTLVGSGNSFTPTISNSTAGTFTFYATQTVSGCTSTATAVTITINATPATPTISGTLTFCAGNNTVLTSSATSGNQWLLNGTAISGATNQTLTVSTAGDYTVRVTSGSCSATSVIATVTQISVPTPTISGTLTFCAGSNTVLTSSATTGNQWLLNGSPISGATNQTLTVTAAGNYSVRVTISGCSATSATVTVSQTTASAPVANNPGAICTGGTIPQLTATGSSVKWYSDAALTTQVGTGSPFTPSISNATAGTFTFYVTQTVSSCESPATSVTITINAAPAKPTISGTLTFCTGGNTVLTSSATTGNQWLLNGSPISGATNQTLTVTAAGNYSVRVTSNGCSTTSDPVAVSQANATAPIASSPAAICTGDAIPALTASGTNIQWYSDAALTNLVGSGSPFTPTINNAVAGTTTFYVTQTVSGCTSTATAVTVTINAKPATPTISGTLTFCTGNNTVLTSSASTGNQWFLNGTAISGATNQTLTVSTAGDYTVRVTSGSCSATSAIATVTQISVPTPTISGTLTFCAGSNTVLTSSASTGNQWLLNGTAISGATNQTLTVTAAGNYSVRVTISGCSATSAVATVTQTTASAPVANNPAAICTGGTIPQLTATGSNIQWYSDASLATLVGSGNSFTPTISNSTAGTFTFYATQTVSGCTSTATAVTITINATPATPTISGTLTFCVGNNTVLTSSAATGNQWFLNGTAISGATNQTLTVSTAGNYTVTVTSNGCSATSATATVTEGSATTPTISGTLTFCTGGNTILTSSASTGNQWLLNGSPISGATNQTLTVTTAGNYSVTVNSGSCSATSAVATVSVTNTAAPVASSPAAICTGDAIPALTASGTNIQWYSDAALTNLVGSGSPFTPTINNAVAGTTTFYVTQTVSGCTSTATAVTVTINTKPATPTISGTLTFCTGSNTVLTSSAVSGNQWFLNGTAISGATNQTLTVSTAGDYTVRVTSGSCSATSSSVTVTQSTLAATVTSTNPTCADASAGTLTVSATGGISPYSYSLDGVTFSNTTGVFTSLTAGNYIVYTKDASGCVVSSSRTLNAASSITAVTVTAVNETGCSTSDGTITVSGVTGGTAPYQYYINGSANPAGINNNVFAGLVTGSYTIRIVDANGCEITRTSAVGTDCPTCTLSASVSSQVNPTCAGNDGSITLTASNGTGAISYSIDGGSNYNTNPVFSNLTAGTYTIVVKDANNCIVNVGTVTLTSPVAITATVSGSNPTTCGVNNGTITVSNVSGGTAPYQYSIDGVNFQTSNTFTGLAGNSYSVSVRDANNCKVSYTQVITAPNGISAVTVNTTSESGCSTLDGTITVTVTGGKAPYQYYINGAANPAGINNNEFSNLAGQIYTIRVVTADGCFFNTTAAVGTNCPGGCTLAAASTVTDLVCHNGTTGRITVSASGGTGLYEYSLDGTTYQNIAVFNNLTAGNYTVYTRDKNQPSCVVTNAVTLTNPPAITGLITSSVDPTCQNNDGSITVSVSGGSGSLQYSLNGGSATNSPVFSGLAAGTYTITATDSKGCSATIGTVTLSLPAAITGTVSGTNPTTCAATDGSLTISGTTGGTAPYQYSINGTTFQSNPSFTGLGEGTYTVQVKDAKGCINSLT
ncbi:hypothetical protein, partial [Xanthocytophaga agilis]